MLTIVDYGLGNIKAFYNVYKSLGIEINIAKNKSELKKSTKLILPGVGSFDWAMLRLTNSGMVETLDDLVLNKKLPILGICVGMQIMARSSEEGESKGLSWIDAKVKKFSSKGIDPKHKDYLPLPHMGWNEILPTCKSKIFRNIIDFRFYFLHSYYFSNQSKEKIASTNYMHEFTSVIKKNNILGVQFHPEKSHESGKKILLNFAMN